MTHIDRQKIRTQIVAALRLGLSREVVAAHFGVSLSLIAKAVKGYEVHKPGVTHDDKDANGN